MLYKDFPIINYGGSLVRNVKVRFKVANYVKNNIGVYQTVKYTDADTLENLSFDLYGDTRLWWIIAMMNNIIDPYHDVALSDRELTTYISKNYDDITSINHYELNGIKYNNNVADSVPVTNEEFEVKLNDQKRDLRILLPEYIPQILSELGNLVNV